MSEQLEEFERIATEWEEESWLINAPEIDWLLAYARKQLAAQAASQQTILEQQAEIRRLMDEVRRLENIERLFNRGYNETNIQP
jgi:hypothetical protein